ncbi:MAG: M48 family metallopeptidase [Deltaproteobacteria bacterium]|jgi:predicted Zn-dependent protease
MRSLREKLMVLAIAAFVLVGCSTVPITGRKQLDLVPESTMLATSFQEYDKFLKEHKLSTNQAETQMVKRVGTRIEKAVEQYFKEKGLSGQLDGYAWEFNLVEDKEANAWCMPGGKVVVYTGILPITKNEAGLATVMGHEIAHAVARHGNERMSQALLTQMGGMALAVALDQNPSETSQLWLAVYGVGTQVGILLPYSRLQESEADHLGLIFMAMAGYDPHQAVDFWQRMAKMKDGQAPPEFLSTHPSDQARIKKIKEFLPEAMKYYRKES